MNLFRINIQFFKRQIISKCALIGKARFTNKFRMFLFFSCSCNGMNGWNSPLTSVQSSDGTVFTVPSHFYICSIQWGPSSASRYLISRFSMIHMLNTNLVVTTRLTGFDVPRIYSISIIHWHACCTCYIAVHGTVQINELERNGLSL